LTEIPGGDNGILISTGTLKVNQGVTTAGFKATTGKKKKGKKSQRRKHIKTRDGI
jgi:hypothetical protein